MIAVSRKEQGFEAQSLKLTVGILSFCYNNNLVESNERADIIRLTSHHAMLLLKSVPSDKRAELVDNVLSLQVGMTNECEMQKIRLILNTISELTEFIK